MKNRLNQAVANTLRIRRKDFKKETLFVFLRKKIRETFSQLFLQKSK
jgi:hypothetical protein